MLIDQELLAAATVRQLLQANESIGQELRRRGVVRTSDAPVGQYAEWLAKQVLLAELADNSTKSYDLVSAEFGKVQVKSRVVRPNGSGSQRQLSPFRSLDFDHALILLFEPSYEVISATVLTPDVVRAAGKYKAHVNGIVLSATPAVLQLGADISARFAEPPTLSPSEVLSLTGARHMAYDDYDGNEIYTCRACGTQVRAMDSENLFDALLDVRCPACDCILAVVEFPFD